MLQNLWACDGAFLVDVPHHDHGNALCLCFVNEGERRLFHLRNAAGRGIYRCGINGLNGVDDHHVGLDFIGLLEDVFDIGFGQDKQRFANDAQAFCTELELSAGVLTGNVKNASGFSQGVANLHQQRGFSNAGLSRQKNHRAMHQAAAQYAIQLAKPRVLAHIIRDLQFAKANRAVLTGGGDHADALRCGACGGSYLLHVLHKAVPSIAVGAFSHPFRGFILAFGADVKRFQALHFEPSFLPLRFLLLLYRRTRVFARLFCKTFYSAESSVCIIAANSVKASCCK